MPSPVTGDSASKVSPDSAVLHSPATNITAAQTPRGASSSITSRIRSRIEMMPTGLSSSSTGRCRKPPWSMTAAACPGRSSGPTVSGSCVIQAPTFVPSTPPVATARSTSRSVRIPDSRSPLRTSAAPTPRPCIWAAASVRGSVASTARSVVDITSRTVAISVTQLLPAPVDERLQLRFQVRIDRRLLVLLQRLLPDLARARGRVVGAVAVPALEVLGGRDKRPVEAFAEALERVCGAEEVPSLADLLVRRIREGLLVDSQRLERCVQHPQLLDVDDELLVAGDEGRFEPARRVHHEIRAGEEGGPERHHRLVARLGVH